MTRLDLLLVLYTLLALVLPRLIHRAREKKRIAALRPAVKSNNDFKPLKMPTEPSGRTVTVDSSSNAYLHLHAQKITEKDLALFDRYGITDWNGQKFNPALTLKYGEWLVNEDKSIIFKALGGGSFEIPEMYALIYKGVKVHIECGGGGKESIEFAKDNQQSHLVTVYVSRVQIPTELALEQEAVLTLISEAFAAYFFGSGSTSTGRLTVNFNMFTPASKATSSSTK